MMDGAESSMKASDIHSEVETYIDDLWAEADQDLNKELDYFELSELINKLNINI